VRDSGLQEAIQAAGSVSELARRIGIAQPSVSNWDRIPAERVAAVETATGVPRVRLRPDLFEKGAADTEVDPTDAARGHEYALLATLLSRAPNAALLDSLCKLRGDPTPLGLAHAALGEAASKTNVAKAEREFFQLFIGLGRGELLPYASYYLTGFLNERPLSSLRADLAELGIERIATNYEPEDHAATLCEIMSGLASGRFGAPAAAQRDLFTRHMAPWIFRLFSDIENIEGAPFYRAVGTAGRVFMEIEAEAFTLAD